MIPARGPLIAVFLASEQAFWGQARPGHRPPGGRRMARGWQVPVWGRRLASGGQEALETK